MIPNFFFFFFPTHNYLESKVTDDHCEKKGGWIYIIKKKKSRGHEGGKKTGKKNLLKIRVRSVSQWTNLSAIQKI